VGGDGTRISGGCLCGAVRYEASEPPSFMGHCYCADCRKASGSGFIPFMNFPARALRFTGEVMQFRSKAASGREAVRNFCARCHSLVFGGDIGASDWHTIYAGSLDEPSLFAPSLAIFGQGKPDWAVVPAGVAVFPGMPQ